MCLFSFSSSIMEVVAAPPMSQRADMQLRHSGVNSTGKLQVNFQGCSQLQGYPRKSAKAPERNLAPRQPTPPPRPKVALRVSGVDGRGGSGPA